MHYYSAVVLVLEWVVDLELILFQELEFVVMMVLVVVESLP